MHCEWISQLDKSLIQPRLSATGLVMGCSSYITRKIAEAYPFYPGYLQTLHNGVNLKDFIAHYRAVRERKIWYRKYRYQKNTGKTCRLLFVGRISPEKGVHTLIQAFNRVVEKYPGVQLDIIGDDRMLPQDFIVDVSKEVHVRALRRFYKNNNPRQYLKDLKAMLTPQARQRVKFWGVIPHNAVTGYYKQADILVNPSLSESFGISLIEAMAAGLAVVATRVGGMVDIIQHQKTGIFVNPEAPDELAKAINLLIAHRPLRSLLQQFGRSHCEKSFSWQKIVKDLLKAYEKLLSKASLN
jgi:glycosyltransferase involved in cell wall biosynthesis